MQCGTMADRLPETPHAQCTPMQPGAAACVSCRLVYNFALFIFSFLAIFAALRADLHMPACGPPAAARLGAAAVRTVRAAAVQPQGTPSPATR